MTNTVPTDIRRPNPTAPITYTVTKLPALRMRKLLLGEEVPGYSVAGQDGYYVFEYIETTHFRRDASDMEDWYTDIWKPLTVITE